LSVHLNIISYFNGKVSADDIERTSPSPEDVEILRYYWPEISPHCPEQQYPCKDLVYCFPEADMCGGRDVCLDRSDDYNAICMETTTEGPEGAEEGVENSENEEEEEGDLVSQSQAANGLVAVGVPVTILSMVGVGAGVIVAAKKYKWKIFPQLPSTSVS